MKLFRIVGFLLCLAIAFAPAPMPLVVITGLCVALVLELAASYLRSGRSVPLAIALGNGALCLAGSIFGVDLALLFFAAWVLNFLAIWLGSGRRIDAGALAFLPPALALIPSALTGADPARWSGSIELMLFFLALGLQDSTAMWIGRRWPRLRLLAPISPNKTISGAVAGFFAGLLLWVGLASALALAVPLWLPPVALLAGQLGDLYYSAIKRALAIKDFSDILGDKGGLLDRADSTIVALAATALLMR